jgi:hypothetical protein
VVVGQSALGAGNTARGSGAGAEPSPGDPDAQAAIASDQLAATRASERIGMSFSSKSIEQEAA